MKVREILGLIGDNQIQVWKMPSDNEINAELIYEGQANSYDNDEDLYITNIYAVNDCVCLEVE